MHHWGVVQLSTSMPARMCWLSSPGGHGTGWPATLALSSCIVALTRRCVPYAAQEVIREVQAKLESAVEALALPAWPPAAVAASRRAAVHLAHRFGRGLRLLAAVCAFDSSLPRTALQRLALERLVTAQLLPYARSAAGNPALAADRASRIVAALPADWFRSGTPPKGGEGLAELLGTLARSLEAQAGSGGGTTAAVAVARQVAAALHHIGDTARANKLAKAFGVL